MSEVQLLFLFGGGPLRTSQPFPQAPQARSTGKSSWGAVGTQQCSTMCPGAVSGSGRGLLPISLYWVLEGFSLATVIWDLLQEAFLAYSDGAGPSPLLG